MTQGIGRLISLGIAKETSRGTAIASAAYWLAYSDAVLDEKFNNVFDVESYGVIEDSANATRTKNWSEGNVKAPIGDQSFPLLLVSLLGTDTPALHAGETTVYDHAITVQEGAQHQSLTFFKHNPLSAQDYTYANGVVHKMELDYALGKFVDFNASIMALKGTQVSTLTVSQSAENRFVPQYLTFKMASALSGLNAASATKIRSAKLTIDANIESYDVLGQTNPADFLNKEFKVEGQIEAIWQNESDFFTAALANTAKAMRLDLINTDVTIGSAAHPEVKIDLAKIFFTEIGVPIKIKDLVYQTLKFKAVYSLSDAQMIKITCTNTVASY